LTAVSRAPDTPDQGAERRRWHRGVAEREIVAPLLKANFYH
jgi:hypothetical protein